MAVVDRRDKTKAYEGGSSEIAVYLDATQAAAAFSDASAGAAWYIIGYQEGGEFGPDRETEEIKDEADVLVIAKTTRDEFVITNTVMQTDDDTLSLLDWMEDAANGVPCRYRLPTRNLATVDSQWVFLYNVNTRKENWRVGTARDAVRTRQFTLVGTKDANGDLRVVVTLPADQGAAAWSAYGLFKDTPA